MKATMKRLLTFVLFCLLGRAAHAEPRFTVVTVDPAREPMQLFLKDDSGAPFKTFKRLAAWLEARGQVMSFAMNGGMYHADFAPVGLLVQNGKQAAPLNLADGKGNFFLKPNGVFLLTTAGPMVIASTEYPYVKHKVVLATQSGPLLLRHGVIHKAFSPKSVSRHIRNGVGVVDGKAVFAISDGPVTLHEMAVYFRDTLKCRDALYLDGAVSAIHAPALGRSDSRGALGPIIAVLAPGPGRQEK